MLDGQEMGRFLMVREESLQKSKWGRLDDHVVMDENQRCSVSSF